MLKMAMLKEKIKIDMMTPSLVEEMKVMACGSKEINSSDSTSVFI